MIAIVIGKLLSATIVIEYCFAGSNAAIIVSLALSSALVLVA
jgi:hypothetical protein